MNEVNVHHLVSITSLSLLAFSCLGQSTIVELVTTTDAMQPDCSNAGRFDVGSSKCVCNEGFSGINCEFCHTLKCRNSGTCRTSTSGTEECACIQPTSGVTCEHYNGSQATPNASNIAQNKPVVHCKSTSPGIDLANSSIWSNDVCYNLTTDNVMIIDLGDKHRVTNVSISAYKHTGVNASVSVAGHLADGCSVIDALDCSAVHWNFNSSGNSTTLTSTCNGITIGRYIRIQTNNKTVTICINAAFGDPVNHSQRRAKFISSNPTMSNVTVSAYKDFPTSSRLSCARYCAQDPICLNFRWKEGYCSLYGGTPANLDKLYTLYHVA